MDCTNTVENPCKAPCKNPCESPCENPRETPCRSPCENPPPEVKLVDLEVTSENIALNIMVSFLNLAHRRGAFGLDESAKIWECVNKFKGGRVR